MSIVLITMPGDSHRAFANALHTATGQGVDLVIVQKPKYRTLCGRLRRVWAIFRSGKLLREMWYGMFVRFRKKTRATLSYFNETSFSKGWEELRPKHVEVDDINSEDAVALLKKLSPDLIMIWRSTILHRPLQKTAKAVINFHLGISPAYRGSVANQFAVFNRDRQHIGSTIHYVAKEVDSGDVIARIPADTTLPPREMFRKLNDTTLEHYIEIAKKILRGEEVRADEQNGDEGKYYFLNQWTNEVRYKVGRHLLRWERTGAFSESDV